MAYGTIPIAHATGGLRDTIAPFQPDKAGAYLFHNRLFELDVRASVGNAHDRRPARHHSAFPADKSGAH